MHICSVAPVSPYFTTPSSFKRQAHRQMYSRMTRSFLTTRLPSLLATGLGLGAILGGCQHRPPSEVITDWVHGTEGGEIYKLRPPAPGYDRPYPHIGRTPATTPEFPSPEARTALTAQLESQRNYAQRLAASTGSMPDKNAFSAPKTGNKSSAGPETAANPASLDTASHDTGQNQLVYLPVNHPFPEHLPEIGTPPPVITFPGFVIPATQGSIIPDFDTKTPPGRLIRFQPSTDQMIDGQDDILNDILSERKDSALTIYGFGTTLNPGAGLAPQEQNHEIVLGLLRAKQLALYFLQHGVPENHIRLRAQALGDGARVGYSPP